MPKHKNVETPEAMAELFLEYSKYQKDSPKFENIVHQKTGDIIPVPREVPLTWNGFEIWLSDNGILEKLDDYKANKDSRYSAYADIITRIGKIIYQDKYNGAAAGIFNPNIIARDLGLADKKEVDKKTTKITFKDAG
jgi:hypothetical protein